MRPRRERPLRAARLAPDEKPGIVDTDPNGLAAAVVMLATTLLTAVDPSGLLGARWIPAISGAVSLAALLWARRKAWSPASVWLAVTQARREGVARGRAEGVPENPAT